jgi:hypothetical protein
MFIYLPLLCLNLFKVVGAEPLYVARMTEKHAKTNICFFENCGKMD